MNRHCLMPQKHEDQLKDQPFSDIIIALARQVHNYTSKIEGVLPDNLINGAIASAVKTVSAILAQEMYSRFSIFRFERGYAAWETLAHPVESNPMYEEFCLSARDNLDDFLESLPNTSEAIKNIVQKELLTAFDIYRCATCDGELKQRFKVDGDCISAISGALSDRHNGQKSVRQVTFINGLRLYYKPRPLDVDLQFKLVSNYVNDRLGESNIITPDCLSYGDHGWVEKVSHSECDVSELTGFYRRAGVLCATMYVLGATDLHWENVISSNGYPVVIDVETLLTGIATEREKRFLSPLRTGLLPKKRRISRNELRYDTSFLGGHGGQHTGRRRCKLGNINTDSMFMLEESVKLTPRGNLPMKSLFIDGKCIEAFVSGFKDCYKIFLEEGQGIHRKLEFHGLLNLKYRKVLRSTQFYAMLLEAFTENSIDIGGMRDILSNTAKKRGLPDSVVDAELAALRQLDIPIFYMYGYGRDVLFVDKAREITVMKSVLSPY